MCEKLFSVWAQRPIAIPEGFDNTFYPPLESVPHRYAIVRANQYMIETSDTVICYVSHFGNARNLLEYARKQEGKRLICIEKPEFIRVNQMNSAKIVIISRKDHLARAIMKPSEKRRTKQCL